MLSLVKLELILAFVMYCCLMYKNGLFLITWSYAVSSEMSRGYPRKWKYSSQVRVPQNCDEVQFSSNCNLFLSSNGWLCAIVCLSADFDVPETEGNKQQKMTKAPPAVQNLVWELMSDQMPLHLSSGYNQCQVNTEERQRERVWVLSVGTGPTLT